MTVIAVAVLVLVAATAANVVAVWQVTRRVEDLEDEQADRRAERRRIRVLPGDLTRRS